MITLLFQSVWKIWCGDIVIKSITNCFSNNLLVCWITYLVLYVLIYSVNIHFTYSNIIPEEVVGDVLQFQLKLKVTRFCRAEFLTKAVRVSG